MKNLIFILMFLLSQLGLSQCLEGDCFNGYGKFACDCGYVFEGDFKNGERITGTLTKSELVYTGEFLNDLAHGYGKIVYQDSSWYEGTFQENVPVGYGTYFLSNSLRYTGEIENSEFNGLGVLYFTEADGEFKQTEIGEFKKDVLNGFGFVKTKSNSYYFGFFEGGIKRGFGVKYDAKQNLIEVGEFKKNGTSNLEITKVNAGTDDFFIRDYRLKKKAYSVTGILDGSSIRLTQKQSDKLNRLIIYTDEMLYVSSMESSLKGRVLTLSGELFEAEIESESSNTITLTQPLYKR